MQSVRVERLICCCRRQTDSLTVPLTAMAEPPAAPNPSPRFFCHQCDLNVTPLPDLICPNCRSGFIEELDQPPPAAPQRVPPAASHHPGVNFPALLESLFGQIDPLASRSHEAVPGRSDWASASGPIPFRVNIQGGPAAAGAGLDPSAALQGIINQILSNVASGAGMQQPAPLFQVLHGNPGDYVWGAGGLDSVITQLLNNLDGSGPPPLNQQDIALIPTVTVAADDVANNMQCSVCMEDFRVAEPVRKLPCAHLYHTDCIVPWLQMHGTCPICRKTISVNSAAPSETSDNNSPNSSNATGNSSGQYFDLNDYD